MKKNYRKKLVYSLVSIVFVILFCYLQNNMIVTNHINIKSEKLNDSFNDFKIVHLTDLHGKEFGNGQKTLVRKIKKVQPNLIVFTGDLIDAKRYNETHSLALMKELVKFSTVYYVPGNHEFYSGKYASLEKKLKKIGVNVLRNQTATIERNGSQIDMIGIDDPSVRNIIETNQTLTDRQIAEENIHTAIQQNNHKSNYKLLLAHRPESFPIYSKYQFDLVFAGHAHGGQFRIPFIGGLVAPNQGFFPKYTSGVYNKNESTMVVSRGLGNSIIPLRLFNEPEIVVVTLNQSR